MMILSAPSSPCGDAQNVERARDSLVTEDENFVQIDRRLQGGLDALEIMASLFQAAAFFSCIFDTNCFKLYKII
jgi:hypothetical protein